MNGSARNGLTNMRKMSAINVKMSSMTSDGKRKCFLFLLFMIR